MMPLSHRRTLHPDTLLAAIKLLHTAVWTVMAGSSILALPVAAFAGHFRWALLLTAFVVCECAVLAANRGRCPLTDWAARFTEDRAANFDICLPEWAWLGRWVVRHASIPPLWSKRLALGCIALGLMLLVELSVVLWIRGLTLRGYFETRDPVSGAVYFVTLGAFAVIQFSSDDHVPERGGADAQGKHSVAD